MLSPWTPGAIVAIFVVLLVAERMWPLRRPVEPSRGRLIRNLSLAGIWAATLTAIQTPLLAVVAQWSADRRIGVLDHIELPHAVELALAVLLFDYTLWFWHSANHRIPLFWRFHVVHHTDRDLDVSTALRFHVVEMMLSIPYRLGQVLTIGADVSAVNLYQTILVASTFFHHSNVRLPYALERWLVRGIVTPRMHGIHHSTRRAETNSNFSSLLSVWDYLHGTARLNVAQGMIRIGVPAYQHSELSLPELLILPFRRRTDDWAGPESGPRTPETSTRASLLP